MMTMTHQQVSYTLLHSMASTKSPCPSSHFYQGLRVSPPSITTTTKLRWLLLVSTRNGEGVLPVKIPCLPPPSPMAVIAAGRLLLAMMLGMLLLRLFS
uniref:Uncharacterized protein n=1 Tax=Lotus japonicus TaxID=34305 RepID=I3SB78_LOTJA|nr:unknown [Lotus japonicus]